MVSLFVCVVLGVGHVSAGAVPDPLGCRLEENGKAKMVGAVAGGPHPAVAIPDSTGA